jgi:hypothetical protein
MKEKLTQLITVQTKKMISSLKNDRTVWKDIFSFGIAYHTQLKKLVSVPSEEISEE